MPSIQLFSKKLSFGFTVARPRWSDPAATGSNDQKSTPSIPSPAPLGSPSLDPPEVSGANPGTLAFHFRVCNYGRDFTPWWIMGRILPSFGPRLRRKANTLWRFRSRTALPEKQPTPRSCSYFCRSHRVRHPWSRPLPANPPVHIFSAPSCREGQMKVQFQSAGGTGHADHAISALPCCANHELLPGRHASQSTLHCPVHPLQSGTNVVMGPAVTFTPPASVVQPPAVSALTKAAAGRGWRLLQSLLNGSSIATDLNGNIIWYTPSDPGCRRGPRPAGRSWESTRTKPWIHRSSSFASSIWPASRSWRRMRPK